MKFFNLVILIGLIYSASIFATSVNGRFVVVKSDTLNLSVKLQINTDTGKDDMGGATIVISFNKTVLGFSSNPVVNQNYKFHNFSSGSYKEATVTRPLSDKLWINIDLPSENSNKGIVVSGSSGWTDVVTLNFDVKDSRDTAIVKLLGNNIFWLIYDGDNSTSWLAGNLTDLVNAPVQIELLSFTAILLDNSSIQLDWSTVAYADNYGYEIERSQISDVNSQTAWEKIGFIESKNILNSPVNYSFVDQTANTNTALKYRLKSVNTDATFSVLKEIEIEITPATFELAQNYPNPFNPSTKISYTIPTSPLNPSQGDGQGERFVTLKVYDILGNEVALLVNEQQAPGHYTVEFDAVGLASGVYIYRLETPGFVNTKKMILLR